MTIEEKTSFNPGLSFNTPMHNAITNFRGEYLALPTVVLGALNYPFASTPQSYSFGIGGQLSSDITRTERVTYTYPVNELLEENDKEDNAKIYPPCGDPRSAPNYYPRGTPFFVQSDLRIAEWLRAAAYPTFTGEAKIPKNAALSTDDGYATDAAETDQGEASPADESAASLLVADKSAQELVADKSAQDSAGKSNQAITHEVKFEVISSGNVTPTWKLVRVSANTNAGTNLFNSTRDRTSDLLITLAPAASTPKPTCKNKGYELTPDKTQCCKKGTPKTCDKTPTTTVSPTLDLSQAGENAALAAQIGLAVSNSLRGNLP